MSWSSSVLESVTIRTYSQWSINVIKGRCKIRHREILVTYIKQLIWATPLGVTCFGSRVMRHRGNGEADRLAEGGKQSLGRSGSHSKPPPTITRFRESFDPPSKTRGLSAIFHTVRNGIQTEVDHPRHVGSSSSHKICTEIKNYLSKSLRNQAKQLARTICVGYANASQRIFAKCQQRVWTAVGQQKKGLADQKRYLVDNELVPSNSYEGFRDYFSHDPWKAKPEGGQNYFDSGAQCSGRK